MQALWSKILAGEANRPGRFSKRTVNLMSSLDKTDAELLRYVCSLNWQIGDNVVPLVYDYSDEIYGIEKCFGILKHLADIALVSFEPLTGYSRARLPQTLVVYFFDKGFEITFPLPENNTLFVGQVLLSQAGMELAAICGSAPHPGFEEYVLGRWKAMGLQVTELT
jgi:hypothetical protein